MGLFDLFKSKQGVSSAENVSKMMVTLHCGESKSLFLMLADDGTINRMGTGTEDNTEMDMYIGRGDLRIFRAVRELAGPVIDDWVGGYGDPDAIGLPCKLLVGFQTEEREEIMSQWEYGSESKGPPPAVRDFVINAIRSTEDWYEEQKTVAGK